MGHVTAKQRRRAAQKERTRGVQETRRVAHVRTDWEYTGLTVLRCEGCGLEQTRCWAGALGCVVCGCATSTFVGFLEPDPRDVPLMLGPNGPFAVTLWR